MPVNQTSVKEKTNHLCEKHIILLFNSSECTLENIVHIYLQLCD